MQQATVFDREDENEPLDKPQQRLEIARGREPATRDLVPERLIVRMLEKAAAKLDERTLDAFA